MPQLNFSIYPSQLFWLAISFTLLYFIFAVIILPRVNKIQTLRSDATKGKRQQAQDAAEKAESAMTLYESKIVDAKTSAQKNAQEKQKSSDIEIAQKSAEARARLEKKTQQAEQEIQDFLRDSAPAKTQAAAIIASDIIQKLAGMEISQNDALDTVRKVQSA